MTSSSTTTNTLKIILDTNVIISGAVYGGMGEIIFDVVFNNKLHLFVSNDLLEEVVRKLEEFKASKSVEIQTLNLLNKGTKIVPLIKITACRDPKDNFILELAETAKADYIITRDKDLLDLPNHHWKKTKITKPEEFLAILRKIKLID